LWHFDIKKICHDVFRVKCCSLANGTCLRTEIFTAGLPCNQLKMIKKSMANLVSLPRNQKSVVRFSRKIATSLPYFWFLIWSRQSLEKTFLWKYFPPFSVSKVKKFVFAFRLILVDWIFICHEIKWSLSMFRYFFQDLIHKSRSKLRSIYIVRKRKVFATKWL